MLHVGQNRWFGSDFVFSTALFVFVVFSGESAGGLGKSDSMLGMMVDIEAIGVRFLLLFLISIDAGEP